MALDTDRVGPAMRRAHPPAQMPWLVAALGVGAITFVVATAYTQHAAAVVDDGAALIMADASPSIDRLYEARAGLLGMQSAIEQYVVASRDTDLAFDANEVSSSRAQLDIALTRYERIHPNELTHAELYDDEVAHPLAALYVAIDGVITCTRGGDRDGAQAILKRDVRPLIATTWSGMWRLVEWNNADVRKRVSALVRQRRRTMTTAFALDALGVGLVLAMVVLALRTMRVHAEQIAKREHELEHRADAFEQFAARVAHDLGNPLGAALLNIQSLERAADHDEVANAKIVRARRAVRRCGDLVEGLMRFARAGARPEPGAVTLLGDVVREVEEQIRDTEGDGLTIEVEPLPRCAVACSRGVLTSILSNLLENAAKYTRGCDERRVTVRARVHEAMVRLEIDDTGPGVPKEAGASIFEPYVRGAREHQNGMGLGLATVKRLCEAHGGETGIDATIARGSRFWFELPRGELPRGEPMRAPMTATP